MRSVPEIPKTRLSIDVEFKARPSLAVVASPSPEGTIGASIVAPIHSSDQHSTWKKMCVRQTELLKKSACEEYLKGRELLTIDEESIPHLNTLSQSLSEQSGWQIIRVDGFVDPNLFFILLANKCFPCTDFIRHEEEIEYTPAPDMFHDIMGHLPMITHPRFASFFHAFGIAGTNAVTPEEKLWLSRIYWFTVEFGLINENAHLPEKRNLDASRIYGAGIVSSVGEIVHSLSDKVRKIPFDIQLITETDYDIHEMQPALFEISSFDELEGEFKSWAQSKGLL